MMRHENIRRMLYEYVRNELEQSSRENVERHLSACTACGDDAKRLRTALEVLEKYSAEPSDRRPAEYWDTFAFNVVQRVHEAEQRKRFVSMTVSEWLRSLFVFRKRYVVALSSGLILGIILALYILPLGRHQEIIPLVAERTVEPAVTANPAAQRMQQYFRKSKVLLVGISNMKPDEDLDLTVERKASRELIHEARYLKSQPLDSRSTKLINDLENILIELANMEEHNDVPNVEILRGGIHQENLLFKIRMAESLYDSAQIHSVNNNR